MLACLFSLLLLLCFVVVVVVVVVLRNLEDVKRLMNKTYGNNL